MSDISLAERPALSIDEFGDLYGIGRTKTYELISSGDLIVRRAGGRVLVLKADAERWAANLPIVDPVLDMAPRRGRPRKRPVAAAA